MWEEDEARVEGDLGGGREDVEMEMVDRVEGSSVEAEPIVTVGEGLRLLLGADVEGESFHLFDDGELVRSERVGVLEEALFGNDEAGELRVSGWEKGASISLEIECLAIIFFRRSIYLSRP